MTSIECGPLLYLLNHLFKSQHQRLDYSQPDVWWISQQLDSESYQWLDHWTHGSHLYKLATQANSGNLGNGLYIFSYYLLYHPLQWLFETVHISKPYSQAKSSTHYWRYIFNQLSLRSQWYSSLDWNTARSQHFKYHWDIHHWIKTARHLKCFD